jgi:hypothetical protein
MEVALNDFARQAMDFGATPVLGQLPLRQRAAPHVGHR